MSARSVSRAIWTSADGGVDVLDLDLPQRRVGGQRVESRQHGARLGQAPCPRIGGAARVVPDRVRVRLGSVGRQHVLEQRLPLRRSARARTAAVPSIAAGCRCCGRPVSARRRPATRRRRRRSPRGFCLPSRRTRTGSGGCARRSRRGTRVARRLARCRRGRRRSTRHLHAKHRRSDPYACRCALACAADVRTPEPASSGGRRSAARGRVRASFPSGGPSNDWRPDGRARHAARSKAARSRRRSMALRLHRAPTSRTGGG